MVVVGVVCVTGVSSGVVTGGGGVVIVEGGSGVIAVGGIVVGGVVVGGMLTETGGSWYVAGAGGEGCQH